MIAIIWPLGACLLLALCVKVECYQQASDLNPYQYNPYSYGYDVSYRPFECRIEEIQPNYDLVVSRWKTIMATNNGAKREVIIRWKFMEVMVIGIIMASIVKLSMWQTGTDLGRI